jgi:hypothetical protein
MRKMRLTETQAWGIAIVLGGIMGVILWNVLKNIML